MNMKIMRKTVLVTIAFALLYMSNTCPKAAIRPSSTPIGVFSTKSPTPIAHPTLTPTEEFYHPLQTPSAIATPKQTSMPKVTPAVKRKLKKAGTTFTDKKAGLKYVITKKGRLSNGQVTDAQVTCKSAIKKKSTIVIPDTVSWDSVTYKVTSISANAFKNNAKLKKVSIGQNVKKIGSKAFYGCKKVKLMVIRSKSLTDQTIGKKAFAKMGKGMTIRLPKEKFSIYKKILKKKGIQ